MANYMFKNDSEFTKLKAGVFGYLQRDIDKLIKSKTFDAEFVNFAMGSGDHTSWIYLKVFYTIYEDEDDMLGTEHKVYVAYRVGQNLFTRDPGYMVLLDRLAKLSGKQNGLDDISLVKLRILFSLFMIMKCINEDNVPATVSLPTKKWLVIRQKDTGELSWTKEAIAPGE